MQPDVTVTLDTLHLVFSAFGLVQKIATFEKGQGFQALVQYSDPETAEQVGYLRPFKSYSCRSHHGCEVCLLALFYCSQGISTTSLLLSASDPASVCWVASGEDH